MSGKPIPLEKRFWAKVDVVRDVTDACWPWFAARNRRHYGRINYAPGRWAMASRVAWELAAGAIPDGMLSLHTCDNPPCVRNDEVGVYILDGISHPRRGHLWLGTKADNARDMYSKGRGNTGERNGHARHSDKKVAEVRQRIAAGEARIEIARSLGMHPKTVGSYARGRRQTGGTG